MNTQTETLIDRLISGLPSIKNQHARTTDIYLLYAKSLRFEVEPLFKDSKVEKKPFGPIGEIAFPFFNMGNKNSLDLFDLDEFIIFSFYWANRKRYKKVLDIGANIGLHSLILAKCGYQVESFEPDPVHFKQLQHVMEINQVQNVTPHCAAVSSKSGQAEFVRVLGNTTSSHLAGCKNPYGELERFSVPLFNIRDLIGKADFIKMDVEGHENEILLATKGNDWKSTDAIVEIGSPDKAKLIYDHFNQEGVNLFAQKINWQKVTRLEDVPVSYKEGSLFISKKATMPWG